MRHTSLLLLLLGLLFSCTESSQETYFLTKLGDDTLAIERFEVMNQSLVADVILRSPTTSLRRYEMSWDEQFQLVEMTVTDHTSLNKFSDTGGLMVQHISDTGDSLEVIYFRANGKAVRKIAREEQLIPFVDMVHWPYELAFNRASKQKKDSIDQYMFTGRSNANFIIHRTDDTSYTLRHPSRGVMEVTTNTQGELLTLDAAQTTRKLKVERAFNIPFGQLATKYVESDKINSPFGTLSPAVQNDYYFKNTDFTVSYGSPSKRGRTIFGGIVPYGKRWRTGANRATHFKTSKALGIQGQQVPAGEYTLFTILEPNGGTLIINRQTGQNGQSYDPSQDLMRVQLKRNDGLTQMESFTITLDEREQGGRLNLLWDRTVYFVDFDIKD